MTQDNVIKQDQITITAGMSVEQAVDTIIRPSIEDMGFRLVRVKIMDVLGRKTLQIMAERLDGQGMNVDYCSEISHTVSALLDVNDPISDAYHLEVTSPGIDRPLMTCEDFSRFIGYEAKLETVIAVNGRKRYRGIIKNVDASIITLHMDAETYEIEFEKIATAKLILNDALIKAYKEGLIQH